MAGKRCLGMAPFSDPLLRDDGNGSAKVTTPEGPAPEGPAPEGTGPEGPAPEGTAPDVPGPKLTEDLGATYLPEMEGWEKKTVT